MRLRISVCALSGVIMTLATLGTIRAQKSLSGRLGALGGGLMDYLDICFSMLFTAPIGVVIEAAKEADRAFDEIKRMMD